MRAKLPTTINGQTGATKRKKPRKMHGTQRMRKEFYAELDKRQKLIWRQNHQMGFSSFSWICRHYLSHSDWMQRRTTRICAAEKAAKSLPYTPVSSFIRSTLKSICLVYSSLFPSFGFKVLRHLLQVLVAGNMLLWKLNLNRPKWDNKIMFVEVVSAAETRTATFKCVKWIGCS